MRIYLDMCSIQRPMDDHAHKLLRCAKEADTGATRPVSPLELIEEIER